MIAGGLQGSYAPIISTANPTSWDTGAVRIDPASTPTAPIYLQQGTLLLRHNQALGVSPSTVNIGGDSNVVDGAWARLFADLAGITVDKPIHVRALAGHNVQAVLGGTHTSGISYFTGPIQIDLLTRLASALGGKVQFSGPISGSGGILKVGEGRVRRSGNDTYSGETVVDEGVLIVAGSAALDSVGSGRIGRKTGPDPHR